MYLTQRNLCSVRDHDHPSTVYVPYPRYQAFAKFPVTCNMVNCTASDGKLGSKPYCTGVRAWEQGHMYPIAGLYKILSSAPS